MFDGYSLELIERFEKDTLEEVEKFWLDKYLFLWDDYTIKLGGDLSQDLFWTDEVEQGKYRIRFGMFMSYKEVQRIKNELSPMQNELRIIPFKFESGRFGKLF
ncbi:hypothetical protein CH333_05565 [candidate division WOR-3 bacterium JGI_Cruoil_03_44_89]|uniref:Uncharacterized protein n=1 Tax=candidate division WOR-3 bacterium JGI_Cruoil_03_44_89 TaxID=1973748 RepID=A0A235BTE6_UNCW3|nr:MAG: hypothetical protein CH333_05565 [candidate division WOR-3 bacterium JGI_Cruoil_03_44_89]